MSMRLAGPLALVLCTITPAFAQLPCLPTDDPCIVDVDTVVADGVLDLDESIYVGTMAGAS